ncbi:NADPH--cytochrome P450 reductase [Mycena chlorophos]|uniref:Sensitive to high expression protein 9, mitochondrial n=1 Tax=Mycena chlorophos TaxID=658473 RepID=A0A8H6SEQ4_MYCCL|nr:NADPH--cytochrome P450 reductase [Mycena chlorophos]
MLSLRSAALRRQRVPRGAWARNLSRPTLDSEQEKPVQPTPKPPEPESAGSSPPQDAPPSDSELASRLRQWSESTAISVRTRADEFSASARTTFSQLGLHLNRMTGYEEIEALKRRVVEQEANINDARTAAREAKAAYDLAVSERSNSQREINDLLQRKSTWNQADIARFTTLVPQDHVLEQEEDRARVAVHDAEERVETAFTELMRTILARYHEEQVWSDKIRSASTYGSLAALALNLVVFVAAIVVVEPWKRKRLAMTFEKKIEEMEAEYKGVVEAGMEDLGRRIEAHSQLVVAAQGTPAPVPVASPTPRTRPEAGFGTRILEKTRDPDVAGTMAGVALAAGILGWLVQSGFR